MKQFTLLLPSCKRRKDLSFDLDFSSNTAGFSNCSRSERDEKQLSKGSKSFPGQVMPTCFQCHGRREVHSALSTSNV